MLLCSGVVPQFCEAIFSGIQAKKESGDITEFEVNFSMLEIYNEQVRDLLDASGSSRKCGLRIRQHPKKGFYGTDYGFYIACFKLILSVLVISGNGHVY